ncbi:fumarylacetoacetate hydrolase family protein [Sphingobium sp.]|uniref:fumarylacetoacetate hydrolase family protein n=1 Tax=Sphingobium sp. TaxID=1912891 RepID=UPI0028BD893C|nr:fumarylacetoacetate hydrolase family protein [Sphingobium sp.]
MSYKLLTCDTSIGPRVGVLIGDRVFSAEKLSGNPAYQTMLGVLEDWQAADAFFAAKAEDGAGEESKPLSDVRILAPILYPGQIWAAGANYQDHIGEMEDSEYAAVNAKTVAGGRAWHFAKSSRGAIVGHGSLNPLPYYSQKVDWEIELAVVIGRPAYRVSAEDALDYVAGYTIANDLSARDFVAREGIDPASPFRYDWLSHKGFQGACPMGPFIVPARSIADPQNLDLKLWIGDELMQDSNTKHMIFSIAEQIEEISARITMYPGDVILTGTPSGVGMGRNRWLQTGEQLRLSIQDIGELRHGFC